jgi:hypothetical protein
MAGSAATISGTIYSALTSGLGVLVADSDGSDEFASYIEQGISGTELDSTGDTPYIIGSIALHPAGGDAVMVSVWCIPHYHVDRASWSLLTANRQPSGWPLRRTALKEVKRQQRVAQPQATHQNLTLALQLLVAGS